MKTTIEIPDDLFRRAKSRAALDGVHLKDIVVRGLQLALDAQPVEPFRQRFPLIAAGTARTITNEDVQHALEQAEEEEGGSLAPFMRR